MKILNKFATGPVVLTALILSNALLFWMMSYSIATLSVYANGIEILDIKPMGYTYHYVYSLFENLGLDGRTYYSEVQLPIDFVYPILFALSGALFIQYLIRKNGKEHTKWVGFVFLPILGGMSDYFENFSIIYMLNEFPLLTDGMIRTSSFFSILKTISTTLYWCVAIFLGLRLLRTNSPKSTSLN